MTLQEKLKKIAFVLSAIALVISASVLLSWNFNWIVGLNPLGNTSVMNPATALGIILACVAFLLLTALTSHDVAQKIGTVLAYGVLLIGVCKYIDYIIVLPFHIDELLFRQKINAVGIIPSRMPLNAAVNFTLIGLSLIAIKREKIWKNVSQALALTTLFISWFAILGYLYKVPEFYGALPFFPLALHTAICFFMLATACLLVYSDHGFMNELTSVYEGSKLSRKLIPSAVFIPLVIGYLRLWGHWKNIFSTGFGVAILILSITLVLSAIIWWNISYLNKRDKIRKNTERELKRLYRKLYSNNDEMISLNEELTASNDELNMTIEQLQLVNIELSKAGKIISDQADIIVKQKDEQLNRVLDSSQDVIWSFDLTDANKNYISRSAEKLFDKPVESLLDQPHFWYEAVLDEDKPLVLQALEKLTNEGLCECTYRIRNSMGAIRWMYSRPRIIKDEEGRGIREEGILSDVTVKKRADEALQEYQQNLDIIFNTTEEGILLLGGNGRVILFNRSYEDFIFKVAGITPEVGDLFLNVVVPERMERAAQLFTRAMSGETVKVEGTFNAGGETIIHSICYQPVIVQGQITHVCITSIDITLQKAQENILQESEANLRSIFDNTGDAFTLIDRHLNVISLNKTSAEMYYKIYQKAVQRGYNFSAMLPPERLPIFKSILEKVATGETVKYEMQTGEGMDMATHHVSITQVKTDNNLFIGYCITTHDYTEQKKAEIALRQSEERFRALIENAGGIIGLTDELGKMVYVNAGVEKVLGFTPLEFMSQGGGVLIHPDDKERFISSMQEVLQSQAKLKNMIFRSRNKAGEWRWMEGTAINLSALKSVKGVVINYRDVTERKKSEEEKNTLVQQLIVQNNDLLQFSFIASHNLRGPVASMLGIFNLLDQSQFHLDAQQLLSMLDQSVHKLDHVIKDLSEILRIRSNHTHAREWVNIQEIVDEITKQLDFEIKESSATIVVENSSVTEIFTIKDYLKNILYNLISNSIKFKSPARFPYIEIDAFKTDSHVLITVKDNGVGIDLQRFRQKIFTFYQRLNLDIEGKGIGLYMTKTQVHSLNGLIDVESIPNEGTTFTILFPID